RAFSMTPAALPVVKRGLRSVDQRQAVRIARAALVAASADDVHRLLAPMAEVMAATDRHDVSSSETVTTREDE
ncbi:MAG: hypothetical protein O2917_04965, partial [Acidobacteria bacterium]|nr:hypothetical protein [Acidobacteriota bacterium]